MVTLSIHQTTFLGQNNQKLIMGGILIILILITKNNILI